MIRPEMIETFKDRVKERPWGISWDYPEDIGGGTGAFEEKGNIDYSYLNDYEQFCLYVYAWNLSEKNPYRRTVMKNFEWSLSKTRKIASELIKAGYIESQALFSEDTGLLCGRGYWFNKQKK